MIKIIFSFFFLSLRFSNVFILDWKIFGQRYKEGKGWESRVYNLFKEAGWPSGFIGSFLDYMKGFLPIFFLREME